MNRNSHCVLDCFTGQLPGMWKNGLPISIPVAPQCKGGGEVQARAPERAAGRRLGAGRMPGLRPRVGSRLGHSLPSTLALFSGAPGGVELTSRAK